jgi:hypothetical protein
MGVAIHVRVKNETRKLLKMLAAEKEVTIGEFLDLLIKTYEDNKKELKEAN